MQEISIEELIEKAKGFQRAGKKWHFHMLTEDCKFNERKDKNSFVLENETDSENFVVYSEKRLMEEGKELVKILHGEKILEENENKEKSREVEDKNIKLMLEKAEKLNEKGIKWHHHMLFPNCIFNKHKGKWCIVFEDKEESKVIESISEKEPTENLRKIELLYYAQKE
jgi:hypothetical protein